MKAHKIWQMFCLGGVGLGLIGLSGCPETSALLVEPPTVDAHVKVDALPVVSPDPSLTATDRPDTERAVTYEICGDIPSWQRPEATSYRAALEANPRYGEGLQEEPLKSLYDKFWTQTIFAFTTYGLSARMEPVLLSGIANSIEEMESCYEGDLPESINSGSIAEVWLLGYQVTGIQWTGQTYQITVEQTPQGLQFVQFERQETDTFLPIVVVQADGQEVAVASGDW